MTQKQELISALIPILKEKGYKKIRQNWYKENSDLIIVFNIQNSYYDKDDFYVNLGIIIKKLLQEPFSVCLSNCHLQQRVDARNKQGGFLSSDMYVSILSLWEQWYGDLKNLRIRALENNLPMICSPQAKTFLTTVRLA